MDHYVVAKELTKTFKDITAVRSLSLNVPKGQVLGFLGPNGAGKTTTMRMITGYLQPTHGSVSICGIDLESDPVAAKTRMGYLPEGAPLYPDLSPRLFLEFIGRARGMKRDYLTQRIEYVCKTLHLEKIMDQSIETLSKGFKRRVGLAQAIIHDPDILILDEPTDGLDPIQKHEVRHLISSMAKDKAIIISTHILEEVEAICDRVIVISNGQIVSDCTPAALLAKHPKHMAVKLTLSQANKEKVISTLTSLTSVSDVEVQTTGHDNLLSEFIIFPTKRQASILHDISQIAHKQKWNVESLTVMQGKLDEVFRDVTNVETVY